MQRREEVKVVLSTVWSLLSLLCVIEALRLVHQAIGFSLW
jgi:hypothetical protein